MAIFRDATPDSPMYREGPRSYSPHWARAFRPIAPPENTAQTEPTGSPTPDQERE
jgi:hypothetical protein